MSRYARLTSALVLSTSLWLLVGCGGVNGSTGLLSGKGMEAYALSDLIVETASPDRDGLVAAVGVQSFAALYADLIAAPSTARLVVDGVAFEDAHAAFVESSAMYEDLDAQYATVSDYWLAIGFDPDEVPTPAAQQEAWRLSVAAQKVRSGYAAAGGWELLQTPATPATAQQCADYKRMVELQESTLNQARGTGSATVVGNAQAAVDSTRSEASARSCDVATGTSTAPSPPTKQEGNCEAKQADGSIFNACTGVTTPVLQVGKVGGKVQVQP